MRIFILLLMCAMTGFSQPAPFLRNPFSTNAPGTPVRGSNNISITNLNSGTDWWFYGISPNTVARLKDLTNVANAIVTNAIASSNGNYVLKVNGPSTGQQATNLNVPILLTFDSFQDNNALLTYGAGLFTAPTSLFTDAATFQSTVSVGGNQTNAGTLVVAGVITDYDFASFLNGINVSGDIDHRNGNGHFWGIANSFSNATTFYYPSASKLAAFDANKVLTSSVYSDADITAATNYSVTASNALQTQLTAATNALNVASNALRTALNTTNAYVLSNGGLYTNGQAFSLTNTSQASNQVAMTVKGLTGQNTNLVEVFTNTVSTKTVIDAQGRIGVNTNVPNQALHINGNLLVAGTGLITNKSMYSSGQTENQGTLSRNTSIGYNSASSMDLSDTAGIINFPQSSIWQAGNETNGFGRTRLPNGAILTSNLQLIGGSIINGNVGIGTTTPAAKLDVSGNVTVTGGETNKGTTTFPTNNAAHTTIAPTGLHTVALGKGWTNDLGARADLILSVKLVDAVTGDPALAFTNTVTGEAWTNNIIFGAVASVQYTITIPDLSPSDYGSFTDLSGTGASVTILNSWWKLK